jgi:hypothetical protein
VPTRPPIGLEVALERSGVPWLAAEVSGYDGFDVLLAVAGDTAPETTDPGTTAPATTAHPDERVAATLVWHTDLGVFRAAVTAWPDGELWRASLRDQADRTQRREFMRLPMGTPMTLSHERGTTRGTLVDVSEAALRARLDAHQRPALHPGDFVRAAFTLHHTGFMLRGTVLREQLSEVPHAVDIVIMLDIPARTANDLRRNVVFEQVERQNEHRREKRRDLP